MAQLSSARLDSTRLVLVRMMENMWDEYLELNALSLFLSLYSLKEEKPPATSSSSFYQAEPSRAEPALTVSYIQRTSVLYAGRRPLLLLPLIPSSFFSLSLSLSLSLNSTSLSLSLSLYGCTVHVLLVCWGNTRRRYGKGFISFFSLISVSQTAHWRAQRYSRLRGYRAELKYSIRGKIRYGTVRYGIRVERGKSGRVDEGTNWGWGLGSRSRASKHLNDDGDVLSVKSMPCHAMRWQSI